MKILIVWLLPLFALVVPSRVIPQPIPRIDNFTLLNVVTNQPVNLSDYKNQKGVVLIFTSNKCPYDKLYEGRIRGLAQEFGGRGIQFLLINSNAPAEDNSESVEQMAAIAKQKNYPFPYLADKDHKVASLFGATKTPEVFVLQNNGDVFTLKYRGALDDNPQMPNDVSASYVREALNAVLTRQNISIAERRPTGCMIQRE